jgi:cyclic dehypoxanthinyl futalosine synthase
MAITTEQALDCFLSDDLIGIGMEADAVRRRLHPEGVVTYAIEAAISCRDLTTEQILVKIADAEDRGATCIILDQAADLEAVLPAIKRQFPNLWLQAPCRLDSLPRLRDLGLDTIGSSTPESPSDDWLALHRAAHCAGMQTSARIVFGAGERLEARLASLEAIRALQEETSGFVSLAPISFHAVGGRELDETTAVEYLKTLAVTRIYVENIANVQSDWTTQGRKVLQMGLRFGANDVGSVGPGTPEEELRRVIRDAGFEPVLRGMGYGVMML